MADNLTKTTVYVDVEDDISTIIEKVEEAPQAVVALVLPKRSAVLQSTVNMRLLKESTEAANKKVVLVTSEAALLPLAGAAGLPVAKSTQSAPEVPAAPVKTPVEPKPKPEEPYATDKAAQKPPAAKKVNDSSKQPNPAASIGALAEAHERKEPETVELDDEADEPSAGSKKKGLSSAAAGAASMLPRIKVPNFDRFRKWFIFGGAGVLALIVFLYFALAVLPKATINITTTSTPVSLNMNLSTSGGAKKLDTVNSIIPSSVQTRKETAQQKITPTGKQDIGSKATGSISITNCEDSNSHTVPGGTVFTANSLNYQTTGTVVVPAGSFADGGATCNSSAASVNVIAAASGESYNQDAATYTTDALSGDFRISGSAMSGGSSKIVTVVSQQDLNNALKAISSDSSQPSPEAVTKQFKSELDSQGYYLIDDTLKVSKPSTSSSPGLGQQASSATVTVTTTYSVLTVKKADLAKAINDYAQKQIDKDKQKIDTTDILKKVTIDISNQISPTDAALSLSGEVKAIPLIEADAVKQEFLGKKRGIITSTISGWPGVKSVEVKFSPFWVSKVPTKSSKVTVNIQADSGSN